MFSLSNRSSESVSIIHCIETVGKIRDKCFTSNIIWDEVYTHTQTVNVHMVSISVKILTFVILIADIFYRNKVSSQAWIYLTKGTSSDVASGKLKLASVFYCNDDLENTITILNAKEELCDKT